MNKGFTTRFLKKKDGSQIFFRFWPGKKDMPVYILLHDIGGHSLHFEYLADHFQKLGYNLYAFDFAGFGKSQEFKGHIDDFTVYLNETLSILKLCKTEFSRNNVFIIGDSLGALVAVLFAKYYQKFISGLILLAPAVKLKIHISLKKIISAYFQSLFNKYLIYELPFTKEMLISDFKVQKRLQHDELNVKSITISFALAMNMAMNNALKIANEINIPVLVLSGEKDLLVDIEGIKELFNSLNSRVKELNILDKFYHSLIMDRNREFVFDIIVQWVNKILFMHERHQINV